MKSGSQLVFTAILSSLALGTPIICSASPLPNQTGLGPGASPSLSSPVYYGNHNPGDNAGSIGRTYTAFKVNSEVQLANRATGTVTTALIPN